MDSATTSYGEQADNMQAIGFDKYNQAITGEVCMSLKTCSGGDDYACVFVKKNAMGFDGYNGAITGDKEATLGVNCGMTTGRNGVLVKVIGFDTYNQVLTGEVARTLTSAKSDCDHVPCVLVLNDQGGHT